VEIADLFFLSGFRYGNILYIQGKKSLGKDLNYNNIGPTICVTFTALPVLFVTRSFSMRFHYYHITDIYLV
jgi:hypothetical protein